MQNSDDAGGGNISIGEEDQLRDRDMLREIQDQGDQEAHKKPRRAASFSGKPLHRENQDEWHPGDPDQPDRAHSEGLTGRGPAQPDE